MLKTFSTSLPRRPTARLLIVLACADGTRYNGDMVAENFENSLKALRQRNPFRPFTVELVSGGRFEVDFPDALVIRDGVAVFIGPGGVPGLFDHEGVSQLIGEQNTAA